MGRRKIDDDKKKVKLAISVDPDILKYLKDKSINVSSLTNKLLIEYIKNGK